jgi:putative SOS response-associated peptidase YedK
MCGRFTLRTPPHLLAKQFQLDDVADLAPRYNIAPTQDVAVVRLNPSTEKRELSMLRWG